MKKSDLLLLLSLLTLIITVSVLTGCFNASVRFDEPVEQRPMPPRPPGATKPLPLLDTQVEKMKGRNYDASHVIDKYLNQVTERYHKEDFAWLEQEAAQARKGKSLLPGGYWKIRNFYDGIVAKYDSAEEIKNHLERLERWKRKYPQSITPRVAISSAWQSLAGEARGSGYANTVSPVSRKLFQEKMKNSEKELLEARNLPEKCPMWYVELLSLAKWQGWDFNDFEAVYREAIAFEPDFYYFYQSKAAYLLPRFSGRQGQWEDYLKQVLREKGNVYYYLTLSFFVTNFSDIKFDQDVLPWEEAKKGFYELRKTYGGEKKRINYFAKFAFLANQFYVADGAFSEIGDDWDKEVWGMKNEFDGRRRIARQLVEENYQPIGWK